MGPTISRRAAMAGAASAALLPFVRMPGARAATPGELTFGLSSFPPSIQPWQNTGTAAATIKLMIYRGLTSYAPDGSLRGELAESWQPIGTQGWEFKLRDARFQNGEKVTSADVKWTIEQIAAERSTAYFRSEMQGVDRVETPDDRTVRIMLKAPVATLPIMMASYHLPIISRNSPRGQFVGAGPFMIKAQERGVSLELEPFTG
ncbi:MAG TPA: ABC transporter substrate-binding protein, partial [Roseomonas sp.]|nr:ABC transporter substrate-binding protein [Roseomonas sp.]